MDMSMEQFTMLVELMRVAGEGATFLLVLIIAKAYASMLLLTGFGVGVLVVVLKIVRMVAQQATGIKEIEAITGYDIAWSSQRENFLRKLKAKW